MDRNIAVNMTPAHGEIPEGLQPLLLNGFGDLLRSGAVEEVHPCLFTLEEIRQVIDRHRRRKRSQESRGDDPEIGHALLKLLNALTIVAQRSSPHDVHRQSALGLLVEELGEFLRRLSKGHGGLARMTQHKLTCTRCTGKKDTQNEYYGRNSKLFHKDPSS